MPVLRLFRDGSLLEYGRGHFDAHQVYHSRPNALSCPARTEDTLSRLGQLGQLYCPHGIYADFVVIYNRTKHSISPHIFDLIHYMARGYGTDALELEVLLAILYAEMVVAEAARRNRLKRRLKRLGVHYVLLEGYSGTAAASACQVDAWLLLDDACRERGF
jgi:hypothetical protein